MFLLFASSASLFAQSSDKLTAGLMAYERRDYETAARLFEGLASKDEPIPLMMLSSMYREGQGVRRDPTKALRLLHRAAQQNHGGALYKLSKTYAEGRLVPIDAAHARSLLLQAAQLGHPQAQFEIGQALFATDRPAAVKWLRRAASRDHEEARQYFLTELVSAANAQAAPAQPRQVRPSTLSLSKSPSRPAGKRGFEVQVGSFEAEVNAHSHLAMLKRTQPELLEGLRDRVVAHQLDAQRGTRYRVRLGGWPSFAEATAFCEQLKTLKARSPCLALGRSKQ